MSLPIDSPPCSGEGEDYQDLTDADNATRSDGSSTPRFSACHHTQLKFGSCASSFHPPPAVRSGPSSTPASSSSLSTSTATSPKPHAASMASSMAMTDAIAAPSPANTTDTAMPSSTFSMPSTRSPSVSSMSSLTSFANIAHPKDHISTSALPIDTSASSAMRDLDASSFNPALPSPVVETQRRVLSASPVSPTEETITLPLHLFEQFKKESAAIRKDRDQLRRDMDRQTDFHRQLVALCEEKGIRISKQMYQSLARSRPVDEHDQDDENAYAESSEDSLL